MVKIALIGVGYWGRNHFRALNKLRNEGLISDIVVCDTNRSALEEIAKSGDIETCTDWEELVKDDSIKLVNIVSPSPFHFKMAKDFMLAGKDVLVEKPLAMTTEECKKLVSISEETGSGLMVGHIFRFHSALLELKKRIELGEFGEIHHISIKRQTLRIPRTDMGVMLALGIHEVDLTCFLLGDNDPDYIFADMNMHYGKTEEMALIIQKFGKTTAYCYESWVDPTEGKLRELTLIGSKGCAKIDFSVPDEITLINSYLNVKSINENKSYDVVSGGNFTVRLDFKEPLLEEIRHFIIESLKDKIYRANGKIGSRAVEMIEKAILANETKQFVRC